MAKKYTPKKFSPIIYPEWGELFKNLTAEQKGEILMGITMFPDYEPQNNPVWAFIKSQIQNQLDEFTEKCQKNGEVIRNYWKNRGNERLTNDNERITMENGGKPKPELLPEYIYNNNINNNSSSSNVDNVDNFLKQASAELSDNKNMVGKVVISEKFSAKNVPDLKVYSDEMPADVIHSVEKWLIREKLGKAVDTKFIARQFINFAKRQGRPLFKEQDK